MSDDTKRPIPPFSNVIQIGDFSIARRRRQYYVGKGETPECDHKQLETDDNGDIVRCVKCGNVVSAFWALNMVADGLRRDYEHLREQHAAIAEDKKEHVFLKAVRRIEHLWRGRKMLPLCPHCGIAIGPNDGLGGSCVSVEYETHRRLRAANRPASASETDGIFHTKDPA